MRDFFLSLIRLGIGTATAVRVPTKVDWSEIEVLALQHGLSAIIVDGVEKLPEDRRPPQMVLLQWIGDVLQNYEQRYELYKRTIAELAAFYNSHGFRIMVLKGYACSIDWPKPEHRPCGDIDIWQFGQWREADVAITREKGIKINTGHHHHTVFEWQGFTVENHFDFVNVHAHKTGREQEAIFKELGQDDSHYIEVNGERLYLPSPNLHALFLIRHLANHFASMEITLRQVLDWAFFVEKHTKEIEWPWLVDLLEKYHLKDFYNCINAICVEDLGFNVNIFPQVLFVPGLKDRILGEIIHPAIPSEQPRGLFSRIVWKWKRWRANEWKHQLVYDENRWSAFWSGVWNHLLKPSSI